MQNIVDVACQSPPVVTNATKPAVQTAQATDQESFDLVLIKASERIESDEIDSANQSRESKSEGVANGQDSAANQKTDVVKSAKEANQTTKTKKSDKDEAVDEESATDEQSSETNNLPVGYICPTIVPVLVAEETVSTELTNSEAVIDVQAVTTDAVAQLSMTADQVTATAEPVTLAEGSTNTATIPLVDAADEEAEATQSVDVGELAKNLQEAKTDQNAKKVETDVELKQVEVQTEEAKVQTSTTAKTSDVQPETVAAASASVNSSTAETSKVKPSETEIDTDSAPPDTPLKTENLATQATVQTSQIDEPARLAEAPKNEVVTQVTAQIDQMVKTNQSSLRVQLYPEELGHIDLKIVSTKGGIGVTMLADNASTQDVLKSELNSLKQNIEQAGIQLSNLHIGQGQNSNQQQTFEERENFAKSYRVSQTSGSAPSENEAKVSLQTTMIDYRI